MRRPSSSSTSSSFEVRKITGIWLLLAQLAEQLHAVHARHLDVEHGEIDRLRGHALQGLGAVAVAAHREALGLQRHRHRGQDVAVVVDESDRTGHGQVPQLLRVRVRALPRATGANGLAPKYGRARQTERAAGIAVTVGSIFCRGMALPRAVRGTTSSGAAAKYRDRGGIERPNERFALADRISLGNDRGWAFPPIRNKRHGERFAEARQRGAAADPQPRATPRWPQASTDGPMSRSSRSLAIIDASPLLLLSDLAQHTRNLLAGPASRCCSRRPPAIADPLAGPRLTLARACRTQRRSAPRRPLRRASPGERRPMPVSPIFIFIASRSSAGIWSPGSAASPGSRASSCALAADTRPLAEAEPEIVAHMNADHADAVQLYAERLLGRAGTGWRMTGIDPEGLDLRRRCEAGGETARLDFPAGAAPRRQPAAPWSRLAKRARRRAGPS